MAIIMEMKAIERLAGVEVRKEYADIIGAIRDLNGLVGWIDRANTRGSRRRANKVIDAALKKIKDAKKKDKQLIKMMRTMERNYAKLGKPLPKMQKRYGRSLMEHLKGAEVDIGMIKSAYKRIGTNPKHWGPRASDHIYTALNKLRNAFRLTGFIHKQWYLSSSLLEQSKRSN
ncbi:MAG: hypothetical protein QGI89_04110 [Candidatus Woesearchaeota archaeon]|nr:hypothetical protein [Candidatus Woesearchaeota archaeon]